jgi:hypothetical protein
MYKTTAWNRLNASLDLLQRHLKKDRDHRLLDIGASDGIVTREAVDFLEQKLGSGASAVGFDLHAKLSRFGNALFSEYRSGNDAPVLIRFGPFIFVVGKSSSKPAPVREYLTKTYLKCGWLRKRLRNLTTYSLVNPLVINDPRIQFVEWDMLDCNEDWVRSFTVVRASNILNPIHFDDATIVAALKLIHLYLADDGLLLVTRNRTLREDPRCSEDGTLWRKTEEGFVELDHVGDGSCVAHIVNQVKINPIS